MKHGKLILTYVVILMTACLSAVSYELFVFPNRFAPAGLNGICTMIQELTGLRVSMLNLVVNIPLALLVFKLVSKPLAIRSMVYTLGFSFALAILENYVPLERFAYSTDNGTSTILGPLVAGIINGFCYSVVVRGGSYTGGLDYVAALIHVKKPEANFFSLTFALNCVVAGISYFVYGYNLEPVILCILYCFLSSNVSDHILRHSKSAVKFEIITHQPDEISRELIDRLGHSATRLEGKGMYTGAKTSVLLCVINKRQLAEFESIIRRYPGTFAYLSSVKEVVGNFKHIKKNGQQESSLLDDGTKGTL